MQCLFQNGMRWKLIVLDFECRQDEGKHVPNYAVIQRACELCEDKEPAECPTFGKQPWYNFQAYDGYFILDYVNKNPIPGAKTASFSMGGKILYMVVHPAVLQFIDSHSFLHVFG